jgi:STE24 endopeptidase
MMNTFALVILVFLVFTYLLSLIANWLNSQYLALRVPQELEGIYQADQYHQSQEYGRTKTRLTIFRETWDLVILLAFWFSGGFAFLYRLVSSWDLNEIVSGLLYIGIL